MDILDDDIINLWQTLNKNNVLYIMVGGFATTIYGGSRITQDVDVWIKDTLENRQQLRKSLNELGYGDFEELETTQLIAGFSSIYLGSGIELDLMTSLKAFEQKDFDHCYLSSTKAEIENVIVPFLHINQLIKEKEATARTKDLLDVEELKAIINQTSEQ